MKEYKNVRSTKKPDEMLFLEYDVHIASNIEPVVEEEFKGFEYDLTIYTKEEFIKKLQEENKAINRELLATQLALVEVYELID